MISELDIRDYTEDQCNQAMAQLQQKYDFDQSIRNTYTQEIDHVINCILWIEDRLRALVYIDMGEKGAAGRATQLERKVLGIEHKAIMTPQGRAESVKAAAALTGYTQSTIRTYLVNKREEYYRCP